MLWIVAETNYQARQYAKARGLEADGWRYVVGPETLAGLSKPTVVLTGTYWDRKDFPAILREGDARLAVYRRDPY